MQLFSLLRFVRSLDDYGSPIELTYKGKTSHQTFMGGVCSLGVQVLTLIIVVIGVRKVLFMTDPNITSYARPVSAEERESLSQNGLRFSDYDFNLALRVDVIDLDGNVSSAIPEKYARLAAKLHSSDSEPGGTVVELKPCDEALHPKYINE